MIKMKSHRILSNGMQVIYMSQKLPLGYLKWVEETSQYNNKGFIKAIMKIAIQNRLEADVQYPKNLHDLRNDLPFFSKTMKIEKVEKFATICMIKKKML